ncbi:MAG: hypothetical protein HKN15_00775, partial [Xanthomonadales bacterium]|nr:hypothetical protein [Xanthomonadales bacterium]
MITVDGTVDASDFQQNEGYTFARIKVPQGKELLVGLSAEVGLTTDTSVKGKNGGSARAIADASGAVVIVAHRVGDCGPGDGTSCGAVALPGDITLASRVQTLEATLGGVIESCEDFTGGTDENGLNPGDDGYIDTPDGVIDVSLECIVSDEEIGLILETVSANHFNFVVPNLDQGTYDITAYFTTRAEGTIDIDECTVGGDDADGCAGGDGEVSARAHAAAWIGSYMMTVQQVRAVKGDISNSDIDVEVCTGSGC